MSVVANVAINVDSRNAVSKLQQVQTQSQQTERAVDKLNATTAAAGAASAGAASQFQAAANGMRAQQNAAGSLLGSIGRLASAYLSLRVAQQAVQAGIKREESERRLTFLAQGYNEVARAQTLASQSGKRFGLSATESNQQFAQLYGRLRPLNISLEDINAAFVGFNTAAKVSGTSTAEAAGALLQLTQALGSGVLRGQELNSVLEQAPGLVVALTKELGVPVSTLRKLAEEGKITSDVVINALKRAGVEGAGQLEAALKGPAQSVKNLQNSFEDFQISLTNDVIPAVVELLKVTTSILGAFNKLPGPVKTITAVVFGLVASFIALAPAISTAIGLLGGLSLATLAAAGPWIALAAGIGVAISALASYRSEAEKVAGAARGGGAINVAAANKLLTTKNAQIAGLQKQQKTATGRQRGSIDRNLATLRRERGQLQSAVKAGTAATPAATVPNAMNTPVGATVVGGGGGRAAGGGADKAANDVKRAAEEAARAAEEIRQQVKAADDLNFTLKNRLAIAQTTEPVAKRMLEYDIRQNEIAKEYDELKKTSKSADELILINANLVVEQRIAQVEYEQQINNLLAERAILMADVMRQSSMPTVYNELETQDAALQAILDKYPAIGSAADAAATLATSGMAAMIDRTKSAQEVFAEFLNTIANALMQTAAKMIAQYIAIGIARMFAGMGGSVPTDAGGWATSFATPQPGIGTGFNFDAGAMTGGMPWSFAGGGYTGNASRSGGIDGKGGFPAILHPQETVIDHTRPRSAMGSGDVNVVVNVDAKGSSVEGDEQGANQLGRLISAAVQSELIKQQRPGGLLAR